MKIPVSILCCAFAAALLPCACETTDKDSVSPDAVADAAVPAKSVNEGNDEVFTDLLKAPLLEQLSKAGGCHIKLVSAHDKMTVEFYVTRTGKCRIETTNVGKQTLTLIYTDKMSWFRTDKGNFVQVPEMNPEMERFLFSFFPKMQNDLRLEREITEKRTTFSCTFEDKSTLTFSVEKDGFLSSIQHKRYFNSTRPLLKNLFFARTKGKKGIMPDLLSVHMPEAGSKVWAITSMGMIGNDKMKDDLFCVSAPVNKEKENKK